MDLGRPHLDFDDDWGSMVESAIDLMLEEQMEGLESDDPPESPSGIMFCGCETCVTREMSYLITVLAIQGYKNGKVRLTELGAPDGTH